MACSDALPMIQESADTSARPMVPALMWGRRPVSRMTVPAASAAYSSVDS